MRMMAKIQVPTEEGGRAIKDGSMGKLIEESLAAMKPECAYFFLDEGVRTVIAVFDLKSPSDMVTLFEPGMLAMNARVQLTPVMSRDDLTAGLTSLGAGR
jgi:hypothetical protein